MKGLAEQEVAVCLCTLLKACFPAARSCSTLVVSPRCCGQRMDKGQYLSSAVPEPLRVSHSPWKTGSFQHRLDSRGKESATRQLLREDYSDTKSLILPLSGSRYSFVQLTELRLCVENNISQAS